MATLRPLEERDAKGSTHRVNTSITFRQDQQIRKVVGRHDFQMIDNPDYHPPITAQVQGDKVLFFLGTPDTTASRNGAKEIVVKDVPKYIIDQLNRTPIKVREQRPTVYEVKIATIGDVETTQLEEVANDGESVTITPVAPDLTLKPARAAAPAAAAFEA